MSDWISAERAVELICKARRVSGGAAIQLLIEGCAQGVIRSRQQELRYLDDSGFAIPPAVWRGSFLDLDTSMLYPEGVDPMGDMPIDERGYVSDGGYGLGGNGEIQINRFDLLDYLRRLAPAKRGRKPKVDWNDVKRQIFALFKHQGVPSANNPEWATQADVERTILDILARSGIEVAESTAREYAGRFLKEWQVEKIDKGR
jgi:hypothetical protein